MSDWRSRPRNGKAEFIKHLVTIQEGLAAGHTHKAVYLQLKDSVDISLSSSQFNRYVKSLVGSSRSLANKDAAHNSTLLMPTESKNISPIEQLLEQQLKAKQPQNNTNMFSHISEAAKKRQNADPYHYNPVPNKEEIYGKTES